MLSTVMYVASVAGRMLRKAIRGARLFAGSFDEALDRSRATRQRYRFTEY